MNNEPVALVSSASGYLVSVRALSWTAETIKATFGDFNDFPRDLANTFKNMVYLSFLSVAYYTDQDLSPCLLPYMQPKLKKLMTDNNPISRARLELIFKAEVMKLMVKGPEQFKFLEEVFPRIRESFRQDPEHASLIYSAMLDGLKYGIDRPSAKANWKRAVLRKFAKVRELPDLIDLMQKYTEFRHNFCHPRSRAY